VRALPKDERVRISPLLAYEHLPMRDSYLAELDQVIRDNGQAPASSPREAMHRARLRQATQGARAVLRALRSGSRRWRLGVRAREPVAAAA
jgi:2-polyprenyl-3-methyl-5-hydroxy-6-metoxy-1,4-benzoquinol methylase